MVVKEVSVDEGETVLVAVVVRGIASGFRSDVGRVLELSQVDLVVQVSGLLRGVASVRLLLASRVGFSRTYVRTVILLVWVQLVRGLVRRGTCAFVGLQSSISRVV